MYLDDLLVHRATFQTALDALQRVLQQGTAAGLKLQPDKWREVTFLGHRVGRDRINTEMIKVTDVREWPTPTTSINSEGSWVLCPVLVLPCISCCGRRSRSSGPSAASGTQPP